ncbi:MAG: DUF2339 domain-containing protein [Planctomycetota bacterium]
MGFEVFIAIVAFALALIAVISSRDTGSELERVRDQVQKLKAQIAALRSEDARENRTGPPAIPPPDDRPTPDPVPTVTTQAASTAEHVSSEATIEPSPPNREQLSEDEPSTTERPPVAKPKTSRSFEERVGGSLPIWFGAVALSLAGIFLVKHFVERGLLGPGPRVALAVAFGFALLGVATRVRRRRPEIAQGLAAAGVAVLCGAVYSATALYGFLSPLAGTIAQGGVTALAIVSSLRFGTFVAVLGQFGGFVIPAVIGPGSIGAGAMFSYLALLQVALSLVGRFRGWWWVTVLGAFGAFVWAIAWPFLRGDGQVVTSGFAVLATMVAIGSTRGSQHERRDSSVQVGTYVSWGSLGAALWILLRGLSRSDYSAEQWGLVGVLGIGMLILAAKDRKLAGLPWAFSGVVGLQLLEIGLRVGRSSTTIASEVQIAAMAGFASLLVGGGYLVSGSRSASREFSAWLAPLGISVSLFAAHRAGIDVAWPALTTAAIVAALGTRAALQVPAISERSKTDEGRECALWTGFLIAMFATFHQGIEESWRSVGLATLPIGAAAISLRRSLTRFAQVSPCLLLLVLWVFVADHLNYLKRDDWLFVGPAPLSAAALTMSALVSCRLLHRVEPAGQSARVLQTGFVSILGVLVLIWITEWFHVFPNHGGSFLAASTVGIAWLSIGLGVARTAHRWSVADSENYRPGRGITIAGLSVLAIFSCVLMNPLLLRTSVGGWPIANELLFSYGGASALALLARRMLTRDGSTNRTFFAGLVAFLCGFLLVSLQVRHLFVGDPLKGSISSRTEYYAYSLAWLLYGAGLLTIGVRRDLKALRYASLLVILAAVTKVFLLDANQLDGLLRVLSFFGLGVALIGVAWVYQRFVVARPEPPSDDDGHAPAEA